MPLGKDPVIHYAEACTWYGALTFAQPSQDPVRQTRLVQRFEPFFREEPSWIPTPQHADWTVFGAVLLEIYLLNKDLRCLALGEWMAQKQWSEPYGTKIESRAAEHQAMGLSWQTRLWIDDMFMITMIQAQAYRATGHRFYVDRAAKEMVYYLDQLQKPNGLFYHTPTASFFWGRGNGWMAVGMAELLRSLPADKPDLVITHWPIDTHPDHRACSSVVYHTWFWAAASLPFITWKPCPATKVRISGRPTIWTSGPCLRRNMRPVLPM